MLASNTLMANRFVNGKLRYTRKNRGSQKDIGSRAGVSAGTVSRAERGFEVNFTSAILLGVALGILDYGVYDVTDLRVKHILSYMRIVQHGRHAKGWLDYYHGVSEIIRKAA